MQVFYKENIMTPKKSQLDYLFNQAFPSEAQRERLLKVASPKHDILICKSCTPCKNCKAAIAAGTTISKPTPKSKDQKCSCLHHGSSSFQHV